MEARLTTTELHELIDKLNAEGCDYNVYDCTSSWGHTRINIASANYGISLWAKDNSDLARLGYPRFYFNSTMSGGCVEINELYDYLKSNFVEEKARYDRNMAIRTKENEIRRDLKENENAVYTKEILKETEKAIAINNQYDKLVWLPKSQIKIIGTDYKYYIVTPQWLVKKNNLTRFTL